MGIVIFIAMFATLLLTLERHHRRTFSLPRAPFGADAEVDRDLDRVLHDIPAADLDRTEEAPPARRRRRVVRRFTHAHHSTDRRRSTGLRLLRLP